jgi:hypothetical protein
MVAIMSMVIAIIIIMYRVYKQLLAKALPPSVINQDSITDLGHEEYKLLINDHDDDNTVAASVAVADNDNKVDEVKHDSHYQSVDKDQVASSTPVNVKHDASSVLFERIDADAQLRELWPHGIPSLTMHLKPTKRMLSLLIYSLPRLLPLNSFSLRWFCAFF